VAALTVACVNVGNYLGMGEKYVDTLASMARRHLPPHDFVCIDESRFKRWWAKLELFKPGRFTGNVLYFDLDVVISGDLTGLLGCLEWGDFWALDDFAWALSRAPQWAMAERLKTLKPHVMRGKNAFKRTMGGWGTCNSSVMLWRGDAGRDIWEWYQPAAVDRLHGDQNWITRVMGHRMKLIPPGWAGSYRLGPPGCPITVYHGDGKPHEVHDPDWY